MKKLLSFLAIVALALVAFTACRGNENEDRFRIPEGHPLEMLEVAMSYFPEYADSGAQHLASANTIHYGLVEANPWIGVVGGGGLFSMAAVDTDVAVLLGTTGGLIAMNEFEQFGEGGVVTVAHDVETRTLVMTQHYDVYWHDGVPLTLYDLWFAFHILAHPEHQGPRNHRTGGNSEIVGIWDYHNGYADSIEGLVLSNNNRTLTIYFEEFAPTLLYFGVWTSPLPAHIFGAYYPHNVAGMMDSPFVRETPIGWGPFTFVNAEPGESFLLRRNENYVWGAPYVEYMIVRRILPELVAEAMVAGEFDVVGFRTMDYVYYSDPSNFRFFGSPARARQNHFAFRMGWWDFDNNENVTDAVFPDYCPLTGDAHPRAGEQRFHDMMRPEAWYVRAAMAQAIDFMSQTQLRNHGLAFPAGSYLPLRHRALMDLSVPMFPFDPDGANALLDGAGFTNRDAEGYRTWLDGERMDLIWLTLDHAEAEWYYQFYTQAWRDVGIRVSLYQGMFHDQWTIWDLMDFDAENDEVHFWTGGWTHGADPSNNMWSRGEFENASRHTSDELEAILARINSMAAWDTDYLVAAMSDLQWYMYNTIFYFPSTWAIGLTAVNNRVANWDTRVTTLTRDFGWHSVRLTAAQPYSG